MKVVFRVDASIEIGTGHVMRCITLAEALRGQGVDCRFICREHPGNLIQLIRHRGFDVHKLCTQTSFYRQSLKQYALDEKALAHANWLVVNWQVDAEQTKEVIVDMVVDWLIVDHYALDIRWETALKPHYHKLMVIDDLADRPHGCELLLDQNIGRKAKHYLGLVSANCKILTGPQYALLRPEFSQIRQYSLSRRTTPQLKRLLIVMGGVDKNNVTGQVLAALVGSVLPTDCRITVVMGPNAPWLKNVREQTEQMPWIIEVLVGIDNMAHVMAESDLAVGASGSTSWERCCLGLPTINVAVANNQEFIASSLEIATSIRSAKIECLSTDINDWLEKIVSKRASLAEMSAKLSVITTGLGTEKILFLLLAKETV